MIKAHLKVNRIGKILAVACIVSFCTGCMNRLDIQKLSIVMAMGIDITDNGRYRVSFQVLQTGKEDQDSSGAGGQGANGGTEVLHYEGIGETLADAMDNAASKMGRRQFYGQLRLVVVGRETAEKGIASIIDFFSRFSEIRASLPVYVTKGEAASIITAKTPEDSIPVNAIDEMIMRQIQSGKHPVIYLAQLIDTLASEDRYPILGVINLPRKTEVLGAQGFELDGIGVFDGDKLISFLSAKEIEGYQYMNGKIDAGSSVVELPDGTKISLEILRTTSIVQTEISDGKPMISINIRQVTGIREMPGKIDPMKNLKILDEIGKLQSENIRKKVERTLQIAQTEIGKDIVDIGGQLHRQHPKEWKQIKNNWEEIFPYLNIDINVYTNVRGTGLITKPPY
jgi:spore germination protein KC